ncbi:MAG: O-antigen ligase-related protein, partial [Candidatus Moranbacteria bacterium GW2011_GWF1_36_4]
YLFYAMMFLLPWQGVWIWREPFVGGFKWEYGTVGVYLVDIFIVLFLVLGMVKYFKDFNFKFSIFNFKTIFNDKIFNFKNFILNTLYLLLVWSFISILWSPDKTLAFYFSFKLFLAIGLFWTVRRIDFSWRKFIFILMLVGALQGALAIGQFLTQSDFSSTLLGTSWHIVSSGGTSVIEMPGGRWLRAYGTFSHPNVLGGYLAIVLLLVVNFQFSIFNFQSILNALISKFRNSDLIQNFRQKRISLWLTKLEIGNYNYVLRLTSYVLIFSGLVVSFSRSAWIVFAIGFILLFLFQREKRRELVKLAVVFLGVGLIWLTAFSPLFFSRIAGEERLEKKSFDDRSTYVLQSKEIIKENFWLGVGAGNYTKAVADKNPQKPIWKIQPVHNVFLLVWSELGIIGLILFLGVLFFSVQTALRLSLVSGILLSTFYFLFFIDHWLWTSHFGIIFFFLVLGLIILSEKYGFRNIKSKKYAGIA